MESQQLSFMFVAAMLANNAWKVAVDPRPSLNPAFAVNTTALASSLSAFTLLFIGLLSRRQVYTSIAYWLNCTAILSSALTFSHLVKASLPATLEDTGYKIEVVIKAWIGLMILFLGAVNFIWKVRD